MYRKFDVMENFFCIVHFSSELNTVIIYKFIEHALVMDQEARILGCILKKRKE
jgi:hypothetical protein